MAFAQLTYRESLRDIEACLSAQAAKLYHMGIRTTVARSTLADANERRDWRIYADFAQRLIAQARKLYAEDSFGVELANTVYALDSTTIDLCLSLFPWAPFRSTKAAVKLHTLLDLRGNIPSFIHISDGKLHDVNVLDLLMSRAGSVLRHGSRLSRLRAALRSASGRRPSSSPVPSRTLDCAAVYSAPVDREHGHASAIRPSSLSGFYSRRAYPDHLRRIRFYDPETGKTLVFLTNNFSPAGADHLRSSTRPLAGRTVLQVDQAASAYQGVLRHLGERREDANLDRRLGLRARGHRQKAPQAGRLALHFATDIFTHPLRENPFKQGPSRYQLQTRG